MGAASNLVREARRRAGLTQRRLAALTGTTQSAIARIESGVTEPSFERVAELVRACGLQLISRLAPDDDADWSVASSNLRLSPEARVRQHQAAVRFARAGREARERDRT
ncbi:MAG TPA: helix-turn-helix transcriptional regulator [Actinomycetota bacterium]|jgi:transcriptional regulator with XRE-family HTH domain